MIASIAGVGKIDVILDCANIGYAYAQNQCFSINGVDLALKYFESYGFIRVTAFIPASYLRRKPRDGSKGNVLMETEDWTKLNALVESRRISPVPPGDNDDVYILSYARRRNGFVVSNDFFRDHIAKIEVESLRRSMQMWIRESRCQYTFVRDEFVLYPQCKLYPLVMVAQSSRDQLKDAAVSAITTPAFEETELIETLTKCIESLKRQESNRSSQLKYLLLARASTYIEVRLIYSHLVLSHYFTNCSARVIMSLILLAQCGLQEPAEDDISMILQHLVRLPCTF